MSVEVAPPPPPPPLPVAAAERRPPRERADIAALGAGLATLVLAVWLSAVPYLAVRLRLPSAVGLGAVDAVHVYVGLASAVFLAAKVARVGFRLRVAGVAPPLLWHRWVSSSLGVLYPAVYVTGILALLRWPPGVRTQLVNAHLIAAVWAAVPTTWHLWHHRGLAGPLLRRARPPGRALRLWGAVALVGAGGFAVAVAAPRAVAPLTQAGAGSTWQDVAPATFLDRMEMTPDGRWLVAGGSGLLVRAAGGGPWRRASGIPARDVVLGLDLTAGPTAAYAGTSSGLYAAAAPLGPYRRLGFPGTEVHAIAVDPHHPGVIWASSFQGFWRSPDAGAHWSRADAGIAQPRTAWGLHFIGDTLLASDVAGVYRWTGSAWTLSSHQRFVVGFTDAPDGRVFASSMGDGIEVTTDGRTWRSSGSGIATHSHGGDRPVHVISVTVGPDAIAYAATMLDGVAVSLDGGSTWSPVWGGLRDHGDVWRVLIVGGQLVAATDRGIVTYDLPATAGAGTAWWVTVTGGAAALGVLGVVIAALPLRRPERERRAAPQVLAGLRDRRPDTAGPGAPPGHGGGPPAGRS